MKSTQNNGTEYDVEYPSFPLPTSTLARSTDPKTSKESAAAIRKSRRLGSCQRTALQLVAQNPRQSANTLALIHGSTDSREVPRRLRELQRANLIQECGVVRDPHTHRACIAWIITKEGERRLAVP